MDYLDFELVILPRRGRICPVMVTEAPEGGRPRADMKFPFTDRELERHLDKLQIALLESSVRRRSLTFSQRTVQEFGIRLFEALITDEVGVSYRASRQKAAESGKGLRLRLRIEEPQLAALPWEFLYDPRQEDYVCLDRRTPVVRWLDTPHRAGRFTVEPPLRILGMIAAPRDVEPELDVAREKRRVEEALSKLRETRQADLVWVSGQSWNDLQQALWDGPWHVFHFIGHGESGADTGDGAILLADADGRGSRLGAAEFVRLLADNSPPLRLVILNSCEGAQGNARDLFSSTAAMLIRRGIPAVLGMQYPISDSAAIAFSQTFYRALVRGLPVDTAVTEARKALSVEIGNTVEWGTPVLFLNTVDGRIFHFGAKPAAAGDMGAESAAAGPVVEAAQAVQSLAVAPPAAAIERPNGLVRVEAEPAAAPAPDPVPQPEPRVVAAAARDVEGIAAEPAGILPGNVIRLHGWQVLAGHTGEVNCVAFAPDGEIVASASADKTVRLWRVVDGAHLRTLQESKGWLALVTSVVFAQDGQILAAAAGDKTVRIWRTADGQLLQTLQGHTGWGTTVTSVAAAPDGWTLASGGGDKTVRLWRIADGKLLRTLEGHTEVVNSVAFAPDGQTLASGSGDKTVRIWRAADGELLQTLEGHTGSVHHAAFSPDGRMLASAIAGFLSEKPGMRLWRVADGALLKTIEEGTGSVKCVAFSPDGQMLASASGGFLSTNDGARLWRVADGTLLRELGEQSGTVNGVAFSPDGRTLATGGADKSVWLWRLLDQ